MANQELKLEKSARTSSAGELSEVIRMSIPIVVATCCRMVMDVSDYWMISRTGDSDALAAILPAQMIMWSYMVIGMGTVSIVNTLASQSLGRGDKTRCSAYAWQCIHLSVVFWLVGAALWPFMPSVFTLIGHDTLIREQEIRYTQIAVWTIGPTVASTGLSSFFNGIHRPKVTMVVALEGVVVNAIVSFVLIFGHFGIQPMGIEGAAWGTVVGTNYRTLRLILALCTRKMRDEYHSLDTIRPSYTKMMTIFRVGGPNGAQWFSDVVVWAIFTTILVGRYFGKDHQLATNAAWQYLRISFMPCLGLGIALSSIVGKCIGEKDFDRAIRVVKIGAIITLVYMASLSIVYYFGRSALIAFFSDSPEVIRIGASVMICAAVFQVFDALGITYNSALRAAGDTFAPSIVFIIGHWFIVIGGGFAAVRLFPELGSVGPWIAASLLIVLLGIWLWWRWNQRGWIAIDVFKHESNIPTPPVADEPVDEPVAETAG
jgi:MATE family, multidrug efflux pump